MDRARNTPGQRNIAAVNASTIGYCREIGAHVRHRREKRVADDRNVLEPRGAAATRTRRPRPHNRRAARQTMDAHDEEAADKGAKQRRNGQRKHPRHRDGWSRSGSTGSGNSAEEGPTRTWPSEVSSYGVPVGSAGMRGKIRARRTVAQSPAGLPLAEANASSRD